MNDIEGVSHKVEWVLCERMSGGIVGVEYRWKINVIDICISEGV